MAGKITCITNDNIYHPEPNLDSFVSALRALKGCNLNINKEVAALWFLETYIR